MNFHRFSFPTDIVFGLGVRNQIPAYLEKQSVKRPLIITDAGIAKLDFLLGVEQALAKNGLSPATFCEFSGNPIESHVIAATEAYKAHKADGIVAIGGGAAIDVAKAAAILANHPGQLFDYEEFNPDIKPMDQPFPLLVALPTTAGTGSEVGRSSVISDNTTKAKRILFSPHLLPKCVFADPEVTFGLPANMTAATGMDALTHNIEAFIAKGYQPICDGIAWEGVRLIALHLKTAVEQPTNAEARSGMLMASMMGAIAFQKGLGITHSCAHALSTVYDLHHGLANGIMLPFCMHYNAKIVEDRFTVLAKAVGRENASDFLQWISEIRTDVGIPNRLTDIGVTSIDPLIDIAWNDPVHQLNPRKAVKEDFRMLYSEAC